MYSSINFFLKVDENKCDTASNEFSRFWIIFFFSHLWIWLDALNSKKKNWNKNRKAGNSNDVQHMVIGRDFHDF